MPHRFPPPEPKPLPLNFTQAQLKRHRTLMDAWHVGNALRAYDETLRIHDTRELPDDIPYLSSPALNGVGGGRKLADNGTPVSMDAICQWIDRQQNIHQTIKVAYTSLQEKLPIHAHIAWLYHVGLFTCQEIAEIHRISYRTTVRYLGIANLYLASEINKRSNSTTAKRVARDYAMRAQYDEAMAWKDPEAELSDAVKLSAGMDVPMRNPSQRRVRRQ